MRKQKSSFFKIFLLTALPVVLGLFIYVMINHEIKLMNRIKANKEELLAQKNNKIRRYKVEVQKLSSEERIVKIAKDSLGLVRSDEIFENLFVDNKKIEQIEKLVNEKYGD
ncbi:MAG: septum formation initiator family protein [Ignavibacteria bacterium]|jgi:cell division protein FtsL